MEKIVFVILDGFADWEYAPLAAALAAPEGDYPAFEVIFASDTKDLKISIAGLRVKPDITLGQIPQDAKALVLVGGTSWRMPHALPVADIARRFLAEGRVVGAICDAARFIAAHGLVNDRQHTMNFREEAQGEEAYQNPDGFLLQDAVRDGNLVTANGNAPYHFAREMLIALGVPKAEAVKWYEFYTLGFHRAIAKYYPQDDENNQ